jgi:hypothetical protein
VLALAFTLSRDRQEDEDGDHGCPGEELEHRGADAPSGAGDDDRRGLLEVRGGNEGSVQVALADGVRRLRGRLHLTDVEVGAGCLLQPRAQLGRLRRRTDDGDLDAVRMRLAIRADDAGRKHDREEDRVDQCAQPAARLLALPLLHADAGSIAHARIRISPSASVTS